MRLPRTRTLPALAAPRETHARANNDAPPANAVTFSAVKRLVSTLTKREVALLVLVLVMASAVAVQTSPAVLQRVRPLFASRGRAVNQVKPALEAAFASVASGPPSPPPLRSGCRWPGFICGGGGASCFSGRGRGLRSSRASRAASESPTVARSGSDAGETRHLQRPTCS